MSYISFIRNTSGCLALKNIFLPSPILKDETEAPESLVPSGKTKKTIINSRTKFGVRPFYLTD
jgi:hypothetical protein